MEKRKKILFILHIPPPVNGAAMVGGFIKDSELINRTFDADYINLTTSFSLDKIGKGGVSKVVTVLKVLRKVFKALRKTDYDLCYMTLTAKGAGFYKDFLIVLLLKAFGTNIIYHFHNKGVSQNSKNRFNRYLYRFTFKNTKSILLASKLYYDIADFVSRKDVAICANGVPDVKKKPIDINIDIKESTPCRFLFLSNMMREKGVIVLLEACKLLKESRISFECHFIGAWSDIGDIDFRQTVSDYGIDDFVFAHGKKYDEEKLCYFREADVFVFPTYYHNECFPLVLLEAMQHSLPIVATPEGGIPDLVQEAETGYLVPQRNVMALASMLEKLVADCDLRIRMGEAGRKRYEELFTISVFEKNLKEILRGAIAESSQARQL